MTGGTRRRAPRRTLTATALGLAACLVAGCGGDRTEAYCDSLRAEEPALRALAAAADEPGTDLFGESLPVFERLRDAAPGDITDEWSTLVHAWEGLDDALQDAGVELAEYRPGETPGVSEAQDRAIRGAAADLQSARVRSAVDDLEQHARDVCEVELGLDGEEQR